MKWQLELQTTSANAAMQYAIAHITISITRIEASHAKE